MHLIWLFASLVVLASVGTSQDSEQKRYDNYRVYELNISNNVQLKIINKLTELSQQYDIWKEYNAHTKQMHLMVNPSEEKRFQLFLRLFNINNELLIPNLQSLIDNESVTNARYSTTFGWTRYNSLAEIYTWLDGILAAYPEVTEGSVIGQSYEGRDIRAIKISYKEGNPGVVIESNIHGCEWITSATVTYFINQLLTSEDEQVRALAENHDWYIVPVLNVDGFVYSHEKDRLWRKNRQPSNTSSCVGADPNRNYDSHWMEQGGSSDPCASNYAGAYAFSEPEIKAMSDYIISIKDRLNIFLGFHSYSQLVLSPYGHTDLEFPDNYDDMMQVAKAYADAVEAMPYGSVYQIGSSATVLYFTSGGAKEWAYNEMDIQLSYTIEFRDMGRYGFVLPPAFILPNCEEAMTGLLAMMAESDKLGYLKPKYVL
ncbi:zinc carboxypeptidase-like [Drosophila sulfurigaster albostrigata]|uniref:zinc carboxypeptidase-like n=1 Tax=Drosophila sulfurigaster albostrigata TaxID=89887 RepID=UPI002D218A3B|nr:zinc carboxypeptidase-like [Drosophila sulfurigaster albostrigata]